MNAAGRLVSSITSVGRVGELWAVTRRGRGRTVRPRRLIGASGRPLNLTTGTFELRRQSHAPQQIDETGIATQGV
jgi:hypothetical protein